MFGQFERPAETQCLSFGLRAKAIKSRSKGGAVSTPSDVEADDDYSTWADEVKKHFLAQCSGATTGGNWRISGRYQITTMVRICPRRPGCVGCSPWDCGAERGDICWQKHGLLYPGESSHGIDNGLLGSHCSGGNRGSAEPCSFASCQCAVLGRFMGRAAAAAPTAV
jgi:hypothetical protein